MNNSITIFGSCYSEDELKLVCSCKISDPDIEEWERGIFEFVQDWISESDSIVVQTSGSTGKPKKIVLSKKYVIASALNTLEFFGLKKDDTAWLCLPVKYIAGKLMIVRAIVGELNLIYSKPEVVPSIDYPEKIDFVAMVPNQVSNMLASDKGISVLENIENLLIGGSKITPTLEQNIKNNNITAWHSYGMTETITHIALCKIGDNELIGDFRPLKGVDIKLNNDSLLVINSESIGVDELLTNDICDFFDDGSFSIIGRKDDVIISGGIKLFPELIESVIQQFVDVEFFVGGLPDNNLGQRLTLFIEGKNTDLTISELRKQLLFKIQKYQIPKEIVYLDSFCRTSSGKVVRVETIKRVLLSNI